MKATEQKILCMLVIMSTIRDILKKWTTDPEALTDAELTEIFNNTSLTSNGDKLDFLDNLETIYAKVVVIAAQKGHEIAIK
jgi:hypothetical protein